MRLVLVYNADSGFFNSLSDAIHKWVSPSTYDCHLCLVSYSPMGMRPEWRRFLQSLPLELELLHRDQFRKAYHSIHALPAIFLADDTSLNTLIGPNELANVGAVHDLIKLLRQSLQAAGISVNTA